MVENFQAKVLTLIATAQFTKEILKEVNLMDMEYTNLVMEMYMLVNLNKINFQGKELLLITLEVSTKENLHKVYIMGRVPLHFQMEDKIVGHG